MLNKLYNYQKIIQYYHVMDLVNQKYNMKDQYKEKI